MFYNSSSNCLRYLKENLAGMFLVWSSWRCMSPHDKILMQDLMEIFFLQIFITETSEPFESLLGRYVRSS